MAADRALQPRKQGKQPRSADTRQRILDGAAHVFEVHGYSAGTTNRIAAEAGVSIGSLYQYFPNKDSILHELVKSHVDDAYSTIGSYFASGALPSALDEQVRIFVRAALDNHVGRPDLHRVLFEEAPHSRELLEMLHDAEESMVVAAADLLAVNGEVRVGDTKIAARLVVGAIESLVHKYVAANCPVDVHVFEDELVAMVCRYLRGAPMTL